MTIQEAIKSGKPFRRKGWLDEDIWCEGDPCYDNIACLSDEEEPHDMGITIRDIMSEDWYTK